MTSADIVSGLVRTNLAAAAAIIAVLILRWPARRLFGARCAYLLWLIAPLASLSVLIPPRVEIQRFPKFVELPPGVQMSNAPTEMILTPTPSFEAAAIVWACGVLAAVALLSYNQHRFQRKLGRIQTGEDRLIARAEAAGIGPAVLGLITPRIVLPSDFEQRFDAAERKAILAHEQAHLAAGHPLANGLAALLQCLLWCNPLVHIGAHIARIDQELACDEAVIDRFPTERRVYAEAMLKTQANSPPLPLGCYWPPKPAWALKLRIAMLKTGSPSTARRLVGIGAAVLLAGAAGVGAWAAQPPRTIIHFEKFGATMPPPPVVSRAATAASAPMKPVAAEPAPVPAALVVRNIRGRVYSDARELQDFWFDVALEPRSAEALEALKRNEGHIRAGMEGMMTSTLQAGWSAQERERFEALARPFIDDIVDLRAVKSVKVWNLFTNPAPLPRAALEHPILPVVQDPAQAAPALQRAAPSNLLYTEPPAQPPVVNPGWLERPSLDQLKSAWPPALPLSMQATALIECRVMRDGSLTNCTVLAETPTGFGAGKAALSLVPYFRMTPPMKDGAPVDEARVRIPIRFAAQ